MLSPFLYLVNLLFFCLLFLFFINRKVKFKQKLFLKIIIILFSIITFFPIGSLCTGYLEKNYVTQKKFYNIDNIIVLAGSEQPNSTTITKKLNLNSSSERLISSIKLALDYPKAKIYFLGGDGNLIKGKLNETDVAILFYKDLKFDLTRINFIHNSRNTIESMQALKKIKISGDSNILITSASHMKRSMLIAKNLNINLIPYAVDFKSVNRTNIMNYYQRFDVVKNWLSFNVFFKEIIGIFAFKLFY